MKKNILVKSGDRMVSRTVEMTQEEIEEMARQQPELPAPEPAVEERLDVLETTTDDMILLMAELIGGE